MSDDFCPTHGYDHMVQPKVWGSVAYCAECDRKAEQPEHPHCPWPRCLCPSPTECDEVHDKRVADVRDCLAREMGR